MWATLTLCSLFLLVLRPVAAEPLVLEPVLSSHASAPRQEVELADPTLAATEAKRRQLCTARFDGSLFRAGPRALHVSRTPRVGSWMAEASHDSSSRAVGLSLYV